MRFFVLGFLLPFVALVASGQATLGIDVKAIAEVAVSNGGDGRKATHLVPADRVVPGDEVIYTFEVRNITPSDIVAPVVIEPVPAHMGYLADSATSPGAQITFSIDGGQTFDIPERLRARGTDGVLHTSKSTDYTHIRWKFKNTLKGKSVAFVRFRAVVK